jgi:transposase
MQGKKNHQEKLFIQFQLSDYVPRDNFYRQLKNILDFGFLYASTSKYYGSEGQKSIDPAVFMKLMLVGYLENLNSDRRNIASSRMRMDILYFLGYNPDEELPWHSTLSRTRQLYGEQEFMSLFKVVLKQCIDKGMVSGKRQAIDSVFVKANAAMSSMVEREILEDGPANKCMIMAAVAYNLKKLINGVSTRVRKRIRKPFGNGSNDLKDTLLTWIINIGTVISTFKLSSKSKWLNNHLLRKLNYSAI